MLINIPNAMIGLHIVLCFYLLYLLICCYRAKTKLTQRLQRFPLLILLGLNGGILLSYMTVHFAESAAFYMFMWSCISSGIIYFLIEIITKNIAKYLIFQDMLKTLHLTVEEYRALPPQERAQIEEDMKECL